MFKTYISLFLRNFKSKWQISVTKIFGLVLAIVSSLIILRYAVNEWSYDRYHSKFDDIYRVTFSTHVNGEQKDHTAENYLGTGSDLLNEFEEVDNFTRLTTIRDRFFLGYRDKLFGEENNVYWGDGQIFQMFDIPIINGNTNTVLQNPNTIVISEKFAKKYFGNENPVDKLIQFSGPSGDQYLRVDGVFQDIPQNSHFKFDGIISNVNFIKDKFSNAYGTWIYYTYIELSKGTNPQAFAEKLPEFVDRKIHNTIVNNTQTRWEFHLQPLSKIHLFSNLTYELNGHDGGKGEVLILLLVVAVVILLIAMINYMNLSTAQAFERAKEVCYRKICGATQLQLVTQHMIESIITYAVALAISIILFFLVLTHVSEFVGKDLWSFDMGLELTYWGVFFVSFIILITPISIYMNVLLSSFKTTNVLIGSFEFSKSSARFRNALIVVQIFLSTLFIFQSLVISDQLKYMASYDSGIDMEHVLVSYGPPTDSDVSVNKVKLFSDQLKELAAVEDVTTSKSVPGYDRLLGTTSGVIIESLSSPGNVKLISAPFYATMTDINYIDFLNAEVIAGRNFNENDWDSTAILNETAVKTLGFESPLSSIDHVLKVGPFEGRRVIGVVKDFNQTSLQKKIGNYVYLPSKKAVNRILIRLRSNSPKQTVSEVQQIWSSIFSDTNFDYFFLDDHFNNQYLADEKLGKVLRWGSWLAILLTSIGIFSASTHSIKQRYREIGIRRVLGATITSIQFIFLKFYAYLICLALVVGIPVSFFISFNWLDSYAYRINLGLVYVVIPTIVIMLVTFMTIGYKVFMASKMNPVETIRSAN